MIDRTPPLRCLVTGASSGIGRAIAIQLASRFGMAPSDAAGSGNDGRVLVHYRNNRSGAEQTADAIARMGVTSAIVQCDLCEPDQRSTLLDRAFDFLDRPTTWVNNAGADVLTGEQGRMDFNSKLRLLIETDLLGTIELTRGLVERMGVGSAEHNGPEETSAPPSLTFIGWDQAPLGMEGDAGQMFAPVKAAVMAYANSLAQELAPRMRVNTVAPGWIKTSWGEQTDSYWDERARGQSLSGRWGTPADVAAAVCFVADPANAFCTGQTVAVNGGWNRTFPRR